MYPSVPLLDDALEHSHWVASRFPHRATSYPRFINQTPKYYNIIHILRLPFTVYIYIRGRILAPNHVAAKNNRFCWCLRSMNRALITVMVYGMRYRQGEIANADEKRESTQEHRSRRTEERDVLRSVDGRGWSGCSQRESAHRKKDGARAWLAILHTMTVRHGSFSNLIIWRWYV